ncbi:MAG: hypothetical protein AAF496_11145 [Pseudomonadota bacterium]
MNANRIIDMIVRQVVRRLVTRGVDKGFDMMGRKAGQDQQDGPAANHPEAQKQMSDSANRQKQNIRYAQRMTRQMRRFMRF